MLKLRYFLMPIIFRTTYLNASKGLLTRKVARIWATFQFNLNHDPMGIAHEYVILQSLTNQCPRPSLLQDRLHPTLDQALHLDHPPQNPHNHLHHNFPL